MTDNFQPKASTPPSLPSIAEVKLPRPNPTPIPPRARRTNRINPYQIPQPTPTSYTEPFHLLFQPHMQYNLQPPPHTYHQAELQSLLNNLEAHLVNLTITIQQLKLKINHE